MIARLGSCSTSSSEIFKIKTDALASFRAPRSWRSSFLPMWPDPAGCASGFLSECGSLREALNEENTSRAARRLAAPKNMPAPHRDIGMALLSAVAVAICLATTTFFWIASGCTDGMTFAQISGVLCCLLATMDDPVPAMRKFVDVTIGSVIAAFIYGFAILPMIDGFVPLVAALGLFLIPAGMCLAVPSLAIIGMGLCINFPFFSPSRHTRAATSPRLQTRDRDHSCNGLDDRGLRHLPICQSGDKCQEAFFRGSEACRPDRGRPTCRRAYHAPSRHRCGRPVCRQGGETSSDLRRLRCRPHKGLARGTSS